MDRFLLGCFGLFSGANLLLILGRVALKLSLFESLGRQVVKLHGVSWTEGTWMSRDGSERING